MRTEGKLANPNSSRKELGIYYTDEKLSKTISKFLDRPRQVAVFDPCCGKGSFNRVALVCRELAAVSITKEIHIKIVQSKRLIN